MIYDQLIKLLRKHLYIVFFERFKNESTDHYIERYVAKHILLKPELIVVNDQIYGFKQAQKKNTSLERFPIYFEIEYIDQPEVGKVVHNVELYTEFKLKHKHKQGDILNLAAIYAKTILLEKVTKLSAVTSDNHFIIFSKLNDVIQELYVDTEIEAPPAVSESELELMLEINIVSFVNVIKVLDEILIKGKKLNTIEHMLNII